MEENTKCTSWSIVYSSFEGVSKRAVELLSREVGERVTRESGIYKLHILPCYREEEECKLKGNVIITGKYSESKAVRRFVSEDEVKGGYVVKTCKNPDDEGFYAVVITAEREEHLYRAAATYLDDCTVTIAPKSGSLVLRREIYDNPIKEATIIRKVRNDGRGIFAWGHPINNYRGMIADMARVGLNRLILWNDFAPLNAKDIVEYAHSFGISVIWGYAWGWSEGACEAIPDLEDETMERLKVEVLRQYNTVWRRLGDGIYFQSFTERHDSSFRNKNIAEVVVKLVNDISSEIFKLDPDAIIEFGLHATSVRNDLDKIANVDPRVEILWEDCGAFPYAYMPCETSEEDFNSALDFTERIINLRGKDAPVGLMFKGFAILDWSKNRFIHQRGPFILGDASPELKAHDRDLRRDSWRSYTAAWIRYGELASRMARHILALTDGRINMCMAGLFDGDLYIPEAICSEIFENPEVPFEEIVERVLKRRSTYIE